MLGRRSESFFFLPTFFFISLIRERAVSVSYATDRRHPFPPSLPHQSPKTEKKTITQDVLLRLILLQVSKERREKNGHLFLFFFFEGKKRRKEFSPSSPPPPKKKSRISFCSLTPIHPLLLPKYRI